jgi:hypothetical protein
VKARPAIHPTLRAAIKAAEALASVPHRKPAEGARPPAWFPAAALVVGVVFVFVPLILVGALGAPGAVGEVIYRFMVALGAAGFASALSSFISARMKLDKSLMIIAAVALAVFAIVFLWNPATSGETHDAVIIVPDANARRLYSSTDRSPFKVLVDDHSVKLPYAGVTIGTDDVSEGTLERYLSFLEQNKVVDREMLRIPVRLQGGKTRTIKISHRDVVCTAIDIDPASQQLIIFEWTKCRKPPP